MVIYYFPSLSGAHSYFPIGFVIIITIFVTCAYLPPIIVIVFIYIYYFIFRLLLLCYFGLNDCNI